jgi:hypothetical protein
MNIGSILTRLHRSAAFVWCVTLLLMTGVAYSAPVTNLYKFKAPGDTEYGRALTLPDVEHFVGEWINGSGNSGLSFVSPTVLYLDGNFKLTDGIEESTKYKATHAHSSSPGADHPNFIGDSGDGIQAVVIINGGVGRFEFPGNHGFALGATGTLNSALITWLWDLELLPRIQVEIESHYDSNEIRSYWTNGSMDGENDALVEDNTEVTFEAPEFIYLDRQKNVLDGGIGEADPTANNYAWYRARNIGYAINGQVIQGSERFFKKTITESITVVWNWEIENAVIVESATDMGATGGGFGNPVPEIGRIWVKLDEQFTAAIDRKVEDESDAGGFRFLNTGYTVYTSNGAILGNALNPSDPLASRVATAPLTITEPLRIKWQWDGQVRYRFSATSGGLGDNEVQFNALSFISVFNAQGGLVENIYGAAGKTDVWIDSTASKLGKVVVGAFYRTDDRAFTLGDFLSPQGGDLSAFGVDISGLKDIVFPDNASSARVARTKTFNDVPLENRITPTPTEITWIYEPTVFRAEVPLGQNLDSAALVPTLPDGAVLSDSGPSASFLAQVAGKPEGSAVGTPLRWDFVAQQLIPVHPGSNQIKWRDLNQSDKVYKIEVVSGYPGDIVQLASERESVSGMRELNSSTSDGYMWQATLGRVPGDFPAAQVNFPNSNPVVADAHYRYLYDTVIDRRAPTKLDLSRSDQWAFQELTYADAVTDATVDSSAAGKSFSTMGAGRSVLLFSRRPNSDEAADGNLDEETLAVRVIRSEPITPILADDSKLVLGRRGLELGAGSAASAGALGLLQRDGNSLTSLDPGSGFVIDFWLNAKSMKADDGPVTILTMGEGQFEVVLDNHLIETSVVRGMSSQDVELPFGFSEAADLRVTNVNTGAELIVGSDYTVSPGNSTSMITLVHNEQRSSPGDVIRINRLNTEVTSPTITTHYRGLTVVQPFDRAGIDWRHCVIHVYTNHFFGISTTLLDFYVDGVRFQGARVTAQLSGSLPQSEIATVLTDQSLRFGVDADPSSRLQLDQFRSYNLSGSVDGNGLNTSELRILRTQREAELRTLEPELLFDFEALPDGGSFVNSGTLADVGIGPITADPEQVYAGVWAHLNIQEVATRLNSTLDNAGFGGSGYILNAVSNYNANLYNRDAEVGAWGPIFPVNHGQLFNAPDNRLEVAYYENPFLDNPLEHPNVAWPYQAAAYDEVIYPSFGPHQDKAIYVASRIGSEGVDQHGHPQQVFDLSGYANLEIYHQSDRFLAGFNPNEEHALVAASARAGLKVKNLGKGIPNNPPLAAFALQHELNGTLSPYSSDPWVLVQVNNLLTGEPEMAAYQVFATREGDPALNFPRPEDAVVLAADGLEYEAAVNPDERFLTIDAEKTYDFSYQFDFPVFAGDLLIPPYPLNLVIGSLTMEDARGGNIRTGNQLQRTYWRDAGGHAWVVSGGGGKFFHQFYYPYRSDFHLGETPTAVGTPVAWLPKTKRFTGGDANTLDPVKVEYTSQWRSDYPKLKRGETLTYQGGEYFNETPGSNGLPALVAMAAAEIVYDSNTPSMVIGSATTSALNQASARIIRPLDRREVPFRVGQMTDAGLQPGAPDTSKVIVVAERWYFKDLAGSLSKRCYFDSLAEKLVFRGLLNEKESGAPDLTAGPDPLNILEPNVMTLSDYAAVKALGSGDDWGAAIADLYKLSQNPNGVAAAGLVASTTNPVALQGVKDAPLSGQLRTVFDQLRTFWTLTSNGLVAFPLDAPLVQLDSFGAGAALVANPDLLTTALPVNGSLYLTIAENNRPELAEAGAPVSLHIIEILPDRYRGAIKVLEGVDPFSEKVGLQHNGEFGANTEDLYYEWWIRDAAPLDVVAKEVFDDKHQATDTAQISGTLKETDAGGNSLWQLYASGNALHGIVFEGRPDVTLADKLVLMRYRHKSEMDWKLVSFDPNDPVRVWEPGSPAPFQWAGAANSPQLQADGSKRYIPQLVMGWIKRVLDRINPYEARYTDFFSNESPAVYSSQLQIAGAPFAGKVALNPDKNVIENVGLIELYETVLQRARELSIDNSSNPVATDGINQALLLAATRLSVLYELLAREAYSDAQDSTITVTSDSDLSGVASFTHAFQNMEADLMHEELALLRGTDFLKSYPVFNRIFWNYAKGLGEAAYNVNYNIYDENTDGFINEDDARALYPQGHGDAWGHFVSALGMHYELLQQPVFSWKSRAELYALMENVLEVDFLDEKTFAALAAGKAKAGRDIVRGTYRLHYTQDPDGQWQGYTDGADPARAWGVSEWAHRAGQGAYFDWAVANAILPESATETLQTDFSDHELRAENIARIERSAAQDEISQIVAGFYEIQVALDEANRGVNPLGFDSNAIAFDIDPYYDGTGRKGATYFEQIYERAVTAGSNALETLDFASLVGNKLRYVANDTDALMVKAFRQDLDYRNRLIEIFGRPYDGMIGFGKAYPEGYEGPDTQLFAYLDHTRISEIVPKSNADAPEGMVTFQRSSAALAKLTDHDDFTKLYSTIYGNVAENHGLVLISKPQSIAGVFGVSASTFTFGVGGEQLSGMFEPFLNLKTYEDFSSAGESLTVPVRQQSAYAFQAPSDWGQRTSYGKVQGLLEEELKERIALDSALEAYQAFLESFEAQGGRLENLGFMATKRLRDQSEILILKALKSKTSLVKGAIINAAKVAKYIANKIGDTASEAVPKQTPTGGTSVSPGDALSPLRAAFKGVATAIGSGAIVVEKVAEAAKSVAEYIIQEQIDDLENDVEKMEEVKQIELVLVEIIESAGREVPLRNAIGSHLQRLEILQQQYITAQAEGFRLLHEREAFNKILAAKVQKNRYKDMVYRISRNEAMTKYQSAFNNAARYAWLAARAYDYETSLESGHPAAAGDLLDKIVKERQLGLWRDGKPQAGQGGLAEILNHLNGNFVVLKGQLGINNPQSTVEKISLRSELLRIGPAAAAGGAAASDDRWKDALKVRIVEDLTQLPEFVRYCRPFSTPEEGAQPGMVIRFSSEINNGVNFFGKELAAGDHSFSSANYATKIHGFGVWLENYNAAGLATTPRAYMVPVGNDYLRTSSSQRQTRTWNVVEQRIPTPFTINQSDLHSPDYLPNLNGYDGSFAELRRHGDFRVYHDNGDSAADDSELILDSRLIGRSVWNSEWMLIIPGANLDADPMAGLTTLAETISDIKLHFKTYSHQGQ